MSTNLVGSVRAKNVERGCNKLRLDWDGLVALRLSCTEGLLDGVDTGGGIARQLDIGTELDRLRCQSSCDGAQEDVQHRGLHRGRQ